MSFLLCQDLFVSYGGWEEGKKQPFLSFFLSPTNYLVIILIFIGIPSGIGGNETASDQKLQPFHSSVDSPVHCFKNEKYNTNIFSFQGHFLCLEKILISFTHYVQKVIQPEMSPWIHL